MKRLLTVPLLAGMLALGACVQVQKGLDAISTVSSVEVTPKQAFAAIGTFDALKVAAKEYISFPRCDGVRIICRDPEATRVLIIAIDEGTVARDELKRSARRGGTSGYAALSIATRSIQNTFTQYNIGRK